MRARQPDVEGFVEREGVKIAYEVFGDGDVSILLLPTWAIVDSRFWKGQVAYLSRHFRVITFDPRGNGRSDQPTDERAYASMETVADAVAILDATGTKAALAVGVSLGGGHLLNLAVHHPDRVLGAVFVAAALGLDDEPTDRPSYDFNAELDTDEGWAKYNRPYWLRDWPGFTDFFFNLCLNEPHSTKHVEDCVGWAMQTTPEAMVLTQTAPYLERPAGWPAETEGRPATYDFAEHVTCPCLVVHGTADRVFSTAGSERLAAALGAELVVFEGSGHLPNARDPVRFNLLLREFAERFRPTPPPTRTWTRGHSRKPRALYLSSPIGLGHALRDVAIATELRTLRPDLEIDWLAQHPVTKVLDSRGERVHPASAWLASESAHIESESGEHDLHSFQAFRRMDEIMVANFHVLHDVLDEGRYDLVIGDEAWDADHFWHENPELKRSAFAWLTDFVGWLPMPSGGEREAFLTADYNAEMIRQVERYPRIRDRAIFVGGEEDVVAERFGPGLPSISDWTREHYEFSGYITGFEPVAADARPALREQLGYSADEQVCVVTVGGSGVGSALLRRVIEAYPIAKRELPDLRMVIVAGPRIDPSSLPTHPGLEVHAYVPDLYAHLAACDLAVVQGGLTTCMELVAGQRPFLYFPLRNHFEQTFHVRHRLQRYGAGRPMDYATTDRDAMASAIVEEMGRTVSYAPVETGGAQRAATAIAALL